MSRILLPSEWVRPKGYSNGIEAEGRIIVTSGQYGWDESERLVSPDYVPQAIKALENVVAVLSCSDATPHDIIRLVWYVTDRAAYLAGAKEVGTAYREIVGSFPVMTAIPLAGLMVEGAMVQIEATAVVAVPNATAAVGVTQAQRAGPS